MSQELVLKRNTRVKKTLHEAGSEITCDDKTASYLVGIDKACLKKDVKDHKEAIDAEVAKNKARLDAKKPKGGSK